MTGPFEDMLLRFEGLNDQDIATINARLPDIINLINVATTHKDQFFRVVNAGLPILAKIAAKQKELK